MLAGLSTPLVLSVHSVVSFDFATSVIPGWHTTIFPPYFVAGAIFGGFAMVLQCMIPARAVYKLDHLVTVKHIDVMCKFILATGTLVGYAYCMELFIAWYSGNPAEWQTFQDRAFGGDLPPAGNQLTLQPARHEDGQQHEHDDHEQRRVGERHVVAEKLEIDQVTDLELFHRVDVAGHYSARSFEMR